MIQRSCSDGPILTDLALQAVDLTDAAIASAVLAAGKALSHFLLSRANSLKIAPNAINIPPYIGLVEIDLHHHLSDKPKVVLFNVNLDPVCILVFF